MAFTKLVNFIWIAVHFTATILFLYGYFSAEEKLTSTTYINQNSTNLNPKAMASIQSNCQILKSKAMFKKMVLILIDGLRYDFVPDRQQASAMPFLSHLLASNSAVKFLSIAETPTVTMPRLKAILAGIKPNFLDLVRNLNAAKFNDDNFIDNGKKAGKRMIFYGDDTWMKMFTEETFIRSNVTYSFFATDYIQVDTNVTENMLPELDKLPQWDLMVLHYLGVDHIGHSFGSRSPLMIHKLKEMDEVIKTIHEKVSVSDEPYLIVVTSDHGMTYEGNHGGASKQEIETPLLFITSKLTDRAGNGSVVGTLKQIDIAATISLLFGLPIPTRSHGLFITPLLKYWSIPLNQSLCYLYENSMQIKNLIKFNPATIKMLSKALDGHSRYISNATKSSNDLKHIEKNYLEFLQSAQKEVTNNQDVNTSVGSIIQVTAISLCIICAVQILLNESKETNSVIFNNNFNEPLQIFVLFAIIMRLILLASTSFVEMEHFFWSYLAATIIIINALRLFTIERIIPSIFNFLSLPFDYAAKIVGHICAIILVRIISSWNNFFTPLIGDIFASKSHRSLATALIIVFLSIISFFSNASRFSKQQCILVSGLFWIYLYRCDTNFLTSFRLPFFHLIPPLSPLFKARLVYLHLLMLMIENFFKRRSMDFDCHFIDGLLPKISRRNSEPTPSILRTFVVCWILLICLLSKLVNIPLIAISIGLEKIVYLITKWSLNNDFSHLIYFIITYLTFGTFFYYSQGNSNDISTIDVASGYIGLDTYMPLFTGILISSYTYSQLIFWLLMMFVRITEVKSSFLSARVTKAITSSFSFLFTLQFFTVSYFMIVAMVLRNHLFIWTVISPKLLYESFQSFIIFMIAVMVTICTQLGK